MILTTTETISGKELETLGLVKGSTIQTVNAVRDIRYSSASVMQSAAEVMAYGTAVKFLN